MVYNIAKQETRITRKRSGAVTPQITDTRRTDRHNDPDGRAGGGNMIADVSQYKAVAATGRYEGKTSDRFTVIPTTRVLDILKGQGWLPAKVKQAMVINPDRDGFQKHMIRLRQMENINNPLVPGGLIPEIVITNAHDGTSSFHIMAGIFRIICGNGLVVADSMFSTHKVLHMGFQDQKVIDAVYDVVETTPKIMSRVNEFKQITLSRPEQEVLAESALAVRYDEAQLAEKKFDLTALLRPRRREDEVPNLWNTYNVLQEKLVTGGQFERNNRSRYRMNKVRGITSVTEDIRINKGLWMLTEKMAEFKQ